MFCDDCGRVLNRATGRCVCAEEDVAPWVAPDLDANAGKELAAVPAAAHAEREEAALAPAPAFAASAAVAAGWYADPQAEATYRWWDGRQWTTLLSQGEPSATQTTWGPAFRAAIPRAGRAFKQYDLLFFPGRVIAVRAPASRVELAWTVGGLIVLCGLLGAALGQMVGRAMERSKAPERLNGYRGETPESLAARPGSLTIPLEYVSDITAKAGALSGGVMRFTGAEPSKFKWSRGYVKDADVEAALHAGTDGRAQFKRVSVARRVLVFTPVALILAAMFAAVAFAVVSDATDSGSSHPRFDAACASWNRFGAEIEELSPERIVDRAQGVQNEFAAAAAVETEAQAASQAAAEVAQWFVAASIAASPETAPDPAALDDAATRVDAACFAAAS